MSIIFIDSTDKMLLYFRMQTSATQPVTEFGGYLQLLAKNHKSNLLYCKVIPSIIKILNAHPEKLLHQKWYFY